MTHNANLITTTFISFIPFGIHRISATTVLKSSITVAGNSALVHSTESIQVVNWGFFDIYVQAGATYLTFF